MVPLPYPADMVPLPYTADMVPLPYTADTVPLPYITDMVPLPYTADMVLLPYPTDMVPTSLTHFCATSSCLSNFIYLPSKFKINVRRPFSLKGKKQM